ncbi:MAG: ATP-binding cassette domain-containing protein, partial [Lysobacter sp.]
MSLADSAVAEAGGFDIDIELHRGGFRRSFAIRSSQRVIAVVGASGAGKTSLLHAIAGLLRPQRGHIEIAGRRLFDSAARV